MARPDAGVLRSIIGTNDPKRAKQFRAAAADPRLAPLLARGIERDLRRVGLSIDELSTLRRWVELPSEGLPLGTVSPPLSNTLELRLPLGILDRHAGFFGPTDSGKTTLAMHCVAAAHRAGTPSVILDPKGDWRRVQGMLPTGELVVLIPGVNLGLNAFEPPPGVPKAFWDMQVLSGPFRQACWLREGAENCTLEASATMFREWEALERIGRVAPGQTPCLRELRAVIDRKVSSLKTRSFGWQESLIRACNELCAIHGPCLCVHKSTDLAALIAGGKTLVIELGEKGIPRLFLAYLALSWIECYLRFNPAPVPRADQPRLIVVLEEFHEIGGTHLAVRGDVLEPVPWGLFRTLRSHGGSLLLLDQLVSNVPQIVLGNALTKVFFRQASANCLDTATRTLGLSRDESATLAELPDREAVLAWPLDARPFVFRVPEIALPPVPTDAEVFARQPALRCEPCLTPVPPPRKDEETAAGVGFSDDELIALRAVAAGPGSITEIIKRANFADRDSEARARARLAVNGLVCAADAGNKRKVLYLGARGVAACERLGIPVATYHSGPVHEWICRTVTDQMAAELAGASVIRSGALNGRQPDARVVHAESGIAIGVQVSDTNKTQYEVEAAAALLEAHAEQALQRLVIVTTTAGHRDAIERALRAKLGVVLGMTLARVHCVEIGTVLKPGFSWRSELKL